MVLQWWIGWRFRKPWWRRCWTQPIRGSPGTGGGGGGGGAGGQGNPWSTSSAVRGGDGGVGLANIIDMDIVLLTVQEVVVPVNQSPGGFGELVEEEREEYRLLELMD